MTAHIAIVTVSDRASRGEYEDKGGPGAEDWLRATITSAMTITRTIIPDGRETVAETLRDLCDNRQADLILITGGTGPAPRDLTPEAMADVMEKGTSRLWRGNAPRQPARGADRDPVAPDGGHPGPDADDHHSRQALGHRHLP